MLKLSPCVVTCMSDKEFNGRCYNCPGPIMLDEHECPDWDYMLIDKTCPEYSLCTCEKKNENKNSLTT